MEGRPGLDEWAGNFIGVLLSDLSIVPGQPAAGRKRICFMPHLRTLTREGLKETGKAQFR